MEFICDLSGDPYVRFDSSLGQFNDGALTAGVIYHGQTKNDIGASIAVAPGETLSRRFVFAMFHFPFVSMDKSRITVCVRASNLKSRKLAADLGFTHEGTKRHGYPDGEAMMIYGLLREECKWLNLARRYGL